MDFQFRKDKVDGAWTVTDAKKLPAGLLNHEAADVSVSTLSDHLLNISDEYWDAKH